MKHKINHANIKDWAASYDGPLFDAILCDPPYELGFMGKSWDSSGIAFDTEMWADLFKLLKPGGHLLAFSGSRTYHRMAVAIEDAGFEIRDQIIWLYGQGFPKALNINKQLKTCECGGNAVPYIHDSELRQLPERDEKEPIPVKEEQGQVLQSELSEQSTHSSMQGQEPSKGLKTGEEPSLEGRQLYRATEGLQDDTDARTPQSETERLCVGTSAGSGTDARQTVRGNRGSTSYQRGQSGQQTGESEGLPRPQQPLDGESLPRCSKCQRPILQGEYKTALKPSHEPAVLARKPLEGTVANNVLKHGTGGLNIDGTRVKSNEQLNYGTGKKSNVGFKTSPQNNDRPVYDGSGRFPSNLIHDGSDEVEAVFPQTKNGGGNSTSKRETWLRQETEPTQYAGDKGSASRFFYTAKASKSERNAGLDSTVSIVVQLEQCEKNITSSVKLAQLQVVMDNSHLKATAESGIGTKSGTEWSMSWFGNQYTEKYPINTKSTTKTTTSSTTTSVILNWLIGLLTNESTLGVSLEMASGGNPVKSAESSNTLIATINDQTALALGVNPAQANKRLLISVSDGKNFHSTVKPLTLTKYLATLIKPPTGGRLLVPFSGSGSEMIGALQAGWEYVEGVELTEEYIPIAEARIAHWIKIPIQETLL